MAFRLPHYSNVLLIGIISFFLIIDSLWAMELTARISGRVGRVSIALTVVLMELSWILSFWPVSTTLIALFLTTCFYGLVGMGQQYLTERLYKKTIIEFLGVVSIVFSILILATRWRGTV